MNTIIGFSQEWKAERALAALQSLEVPFVSHSSLLSVEPEF